MTSERNPDEGPVKRGSFEITVTTVDGEKEVVWSGLKLGLSFHFVVKSLSF